MPLLIGRDARRIEDTWHYLYKGAYWRRGPVTMTAIAAVDTALWDIQGKALGRAGLPAAGRARARRASWSTATRNGDDHRRDGRGGRALRRRRLQGGARAVAASPGCPATYGVGHGTTVARATSRRRKGLPPESAWSTEKYLDIVPRLFARRAPGARARRAPAARRPPPADADRGGAARQGARAASPVLDGGPGARRAAGGLPPDPPAHDDADRDRRGLLVDLRLPGADPRAAHRLHPHDRRARGRHHPPAPHRPPRRALPRPHRLRTARPICRRSAWRRRCTSISRPQLRHPGVHAAHRRHRSRLPARATVRRRRAVTPATRPAWASTSTRRSPRTFPYQRAYLPTNRKLDGTVHSW